MGVAFLLSLGSFLMTACRDQDDEAGSVGQTQLEQRDRRLDRSSGELFVDRTANVGLDFVHRNGMTGNLYSPEIMGSGVALIDYDNDGDLDVFAIQSGAWDTAKETAGDRLFRNDFDQGSNHSLTFTDVTEESGIEPGGYGMGVATGDVDNDGRTDLYVTRFGSNALLLNRSEGPGSDPRFVEVVESAGVADSSWGVSASFLDFDRDGWLDLYVANYVDFSVDKHRPCYRTNGALDYCGPLAYQPRRDRLFRNLGNDVGGVPQFEDVTTSSGIGQLLGSGLGVVSADFDRDGFVDIYVANDEMPNFLLMNRGNGEFENTSLLAGCSVNAEGVAEAGMGVEAGDFDNDGDFDLVVSHLKQQTNTLYVNNGSAIFRDTSLESGFGSPSWRYTGFGTGLLDYDNDGWLDLFVANGAVRIVDELEARGDPYPLHQTNQLFRNLGQETLQFEETTARAGDSLMLSEVSRGVAAGDLDNDGDTDLVVANNNGPMRILLNQAREERLWIGLRLVGAEIDRDVIGSSVELIRDGQPASMRRVATDGSYASANDHRVLFGLGSDAPTQGVTVRVTWLGGRVEEFSDLRPGRYVVLREGTGRSVGDIS